jgi:HD-GYP domain-containing protein (c-di-GMP phosphodiesterase class II)
MEMTDYLKPEQSGYEFLKSLYYLIKNARIYRDDNELMNRCVARFRSALDILTEGDELNIHLWRGRFHVQGERLRYRRDSAAVIDALGEYLSQRGIGHILFTEGASHEEAIAFARLLHDSVTSDDPPGMLEQAFVEKGLSWVRVFATLNEEPSGAGSKYHTQGEGRYEKARNIYINAVEVVKEVAAKASQGVAGIRKARRLAQNIVDLVREDTSLMLGLATIKDYDDYTYAHSVNVALLATCLGNYIQMPDMSLEHLTVCGLLHDLGKVGVSKKILNKQGELSSGEWDEMKAHPLIGVRKILRLNAPQKLRSKIILGPFEHHLNPDLSGYPQTVFMSKVSLIGKILRIADVYEALTSHRGYRLRAFAPDEALRKMWGERGKSFDPVLMKCFVQMMGIYPIGSIVELTDGGFALVMDYPDDTRKNAPLLLRLEDKGDKGFIRGDTLKLTDQSANVGIVRGIRTQALGVQSAEYFLHDK